MQYHWPGNIRELESTVSRAALSSPGRVIRPVDIEFLHASETPLEASRERLPTLAEAERSHIIRVLESVNWNKKQAAGVLEISRGTLVPEDCGVRARSDAADCQRPREVVVARLGRLATCVAMEQSGARNCNGRKARRSPFALIPERKL